MLIVDTLSQLDDGEFSKSPMDIRAEVRFAVWAGKSTIETDDFGHSRWDLHRLLSTRGAFLDILIARNR